jgi:preprotein translocase subunit YajC
MFRELIWLAQLGPSDKEVPPADAANPPAAGGGLFSMEMLLILVAATVFMMLLSRPRKADREMKERLAALKKNDRVVTIGGILGTVMSIRDDNNTVTLKIDESTNTKIQILKTSIARVLSDDKASPTDS